MARRPPAQGRGSETSFRTAARGGLSVKPSGVGKAPAGCACGGTCPRCRMPAATGVLPADDALEGAANQIAERIMTERPLQEHSPGTAVGPLGYVPEAGPSTLETPAGRLGAEGGRPLPDGLARDMGARFSRDLSGVRVHAGAGAARLAAGLAAGLGARAFTLGRDIVFGAGEFAPASPSGQRLIAHELAHVLQPAGPASRSGPRRQESSRNDEPLLEALIDGAGSIDELRAIEDALVEAERDESNLYVRHGEALYTVAEVAYERLMQRIDQRQGGVLGMSHPAIGQTLAQRIDAAAAADDQGELADLQLLISESITWNEAQEAAAGTKYSQWKIAMRTGEELKVAPEAARAALAKVTRLAPRSIDAAMPKDIALGGVQVGFRIAPDRMLSDGLWTGDGGSQVTATLTRAHLQLSFSPGLEARAMLMTLAKVKSVRLIFLTGAIAVEVTRDNAALQETLIEATEDKVREGLYPLVSGTVFGKAGYDPFADKWLMTHLEQFGQQMSQGGGGTDADQVGLGDLSGFSAGVEFRMKSGLSHLDASKTGLVVDSGATVRLMAESAGTPGGGDLLTLKKLTIHATGANLHSKGQPVLALKRLAVKPGARVSLESFELLGNLKDAADIEQLGRVLGGMVDLAGKGVPDQAALEMAVRENPQAELVEGLTRAMVEKQFEAVLRKLVQDHAQDFPGVDLAKAMGMTP